MLGEHSRPRIQSQEALLEVCNDNNMESFNIASPASLAVRQVITVRAEETKLDYGPQVLQFSLNE